MMKKIIIFIFFYLLVQFIYAQTNEIDSLKSILLKFEVSKNFESDTNYLNTLNELAYKYYTSNPDSTRILSERSKILCEKVNYGIGKVVALRNMGVSAHVLGEYEKALNYYFNALKIAEKINYTKGIARMYNNIAATYNRQGKYSESLENHLKALKIREQIGDKAGVSASWHNIAIIYENQGKLKEALETSLKSLKVEEELGNKQGISESLINIAELYIKLENYSEALANSFRGLKLHQEMGDKRGIAYTLHAIATIYEKQGKYQESLENNFKALKICEEIGDKRVITSIQDGLATVYYAIKDYNKSLSYAKAGLALSEKIGVREQVRQLNETLSKIYKAIGKYELALKHYEQFKLYGDSINNKEVEKKTATLEAQYEHEKQVVLIQAEQAKKDIENAKELEAHKFQRDGLILGAIFLILIVGLIFRNLQKQRKAKELLQAKNEEIEQAKEEIQQQSEELKTINTILNITSQDIQKKNKDIQDSIHAALRIQNALLPLPEELEKILGKDQFFVVFKPRNVVSGDFYWISEQQNKKIIVVADSTGHGVPGALMSMIGMQLLDQIVNENRILSPERILKLIHIELVKLLKQEQTLAREGMDIAIITILQSDNLITIEYAGAMNPFYYVQNNELYHIKADRLPLGGFGTERNFQKQTFHFDTPICIYLCSDGYQDQFGGSESKKFMSRRFREMLLEIHQQSVIAQKELLEKTLYNWIKEGKETQTDDITVLGLKC